MSSSEKNMAYVAPEQSFLMDREEIAELEQIIQDVCGSAEPLVGVDLFDANGTDDGPLPWRRIESCSGQHVGRRSRTVPLVCTPSSLELIFEQGIAFPKSRMTAHTMSIRMGSMSSVRRN